MVKAGDVAFLPAWLAGCISGSSAVKWLHINRRKPEENKSSRHDVYVFTSTFVSVGVWCVVRVCTEL